jgi:hypothetical protein
MINHRERIVLLLVFSFLISTVLGQGKKIRVDTLPIECRADIIIQDSQYFLIPRLIVKAKGLKVKVPNRFFYTDGNASEAGTAKFYLKREISTVFVNISLSGIRHPDFSEDYYSKKTYGYNSALSDTINLKLYYPLEPASYIIRLEIDYEYKGKKYTAQSTPQYFEVLFKPKNSIW